MLLGYLDKIKKEYTTNIHEHRPVVMGYKYIIFLHNTAPTLLSIMNHSTSLAVFTQTMEV